MSKPMDIFHASEVATCCNAISLRGFVLVKDSLAIWVESAYRESLAVANVG
jgi:hypothetical protein